MTLSTAQKTILAILVAAALLSFTVAALAVAKWGFARSNRNETAAGITVTDSAQVKAPPDVAFVTFGLVVKNRNAKAAAQVNANRTSTVVAAVGKAGVPKADIQTIHYSIQPEQDWGSTPPKIAGYTASNSVRVRTKDLAKLGGLIDAAIAAGANNVQGISFDIEDKRALRQKALGLAVKKAENKARAIAQAVGGKLGPALSASESVNEYVPYSRNDYLDAERVASRPRMRTPVEPGETSVTAQVKVVYSIR